MENTPIQSESDDDDDYDDETIFWQMHDNVMKLFDAYFSETNISPHEWNSDLIQNAIFEQACIPIDAHLSDEDSSDEEAELTTIEEYNSLLRIIIDSAYKEFYFMHVVDIDTDTNTEPAPVPTILDKATSDIKKIIDRLISVNKQQPVQRTPEWYQYRQNVITASNAYKIIGTQAAQNAFICEKCKPLPDDNGIDFCEFVNTRSPMHWGQKYEPVTQMLYQEKNNVVIQEFGCLPHEHPEFSFLAASPDGIITDESSPLYGRMIEIKNVVSREINGIPKKEYYIQMQLQMEVCNLDICDFVETKFTEYTSAHEFDEDSMPSNKCLSKENETKGIIVFFYRAYPDRTPFYVYKPLHIVSDEEIDRWRSDTVDAHESQGYEFVQYLYWKLMVYSCIQVHRDRQWFITHQQQFKDIWKTILEERETGYSHRLPKKRIKSEKPVKPTQTPKKGKYTQTKLFEPLTITLLEGGGLRPP